MSGFKFNSSYNGSLCLNNIKQLCQSECLCSLKTKDMSSSCGEIGVSDCDDQVYHVVGCSRCVLRLLADFLKGSPPLSAGVTNSRQRSIINPKGSNSPLRSS